MDQANVEPRKFTTAERDALNIQMRYDGLTIFNVDTAMLNFFDGSAWQEIADSGGSSTPTGPAGGDLSGTFPNPSVAKVNGVTVTGTPTAGQVPTASNGTTAAWATPASGGTPGGSDGQVQFNSTGTFAGDNRLAFDTSNGRLSVDNPSPSVVGSVMIEIGSGLGMNIQGDGFYALDGHTIFTSNSNRFFFGDVNLETANPVIFNCGSSNRIYIANTGGIGIDSIPSGSFALEVQGDININAGVYNSGGSAGVSGTFASPTSITVSGGIITAIS